VAAALEAAANRTREKPANSRDNQARSMNETSAEVQPLTSVELLDAAVWREIGSEEPQPRAAFVEALSALVGRWLLVRSDAPEMDLVTLMCRARGYIERGGAEQRYARNGKRHKEQKPGK
jgi:hypothetical protein